MNNKRREGFSTGLAAFLATLGSAVGLGNIWKFPYVVGENGGAAFLFIYIFFIALVGLPVMISEFFIGRTTRKNVVGAIEELTEKKVWKGAGFLSILGAYFVLFYYSCVGGWVYSYVFKGIKGEFVGATSQTVAQKFVNTTSSTIEPLIWQLVVIGVVSTILILGVKNGIEKITKTLMPVLLILIIICDIRALTLPGAKESISFLFKPDFSKVTTQTVLIAMGLAFFKLSVGMGAMVTYGSYFTKDDNMISMGAKVAISDLLVSLLVGVAVFASVFTFGMQPSSGPGLLFATIPLVFSKIPLGNILLVLFFILASIAATMSMTSMFEVLVAYFSQEKGMSRKKAVIINALIIAIFGALATLSGGAESNLSNVKVFGRTFFEVFDHISSNIILPLGGLLVAILVGYFIPKDKIKKELSNYGNLKMHNTINIYYIVLKYVTPVLLIIVFLSTLGIL